MRKFTHKKLAAAKSNDLATECDILVIGSFGKEASRGDRDPECSACCVQPVRRNSVYERMITVGVHEWTITVLEKVIKVCGKLI